jgi:hypothetical protein
MTIDFGSFGSLLVAISEIAADRDHVHIRAQVPDEVLHVIDIVVEVEGAVRHRHHAGVDPVGDVDVLVRQQGAHGVAQQRGVVPRQWGDHQHGGLLERGERGVRHVFLEVQQLAEGLADHGAFHDADGLAVYRGRIQVEARFFVILAQAVHEFIARGDTLGERGVGEWRDGIREQLGRGIGPLHQRVQEGALHLVQLIKHGFSFTLLCLHTFVQQIQSIIGQLAWRGAT